MTALLAATPSGFRIRHDFEDAWLEWPGGRLPLGDHYGDPTCALLNPDEGWCVVGGEGLVIHDVGAPFTVAAPPRPDPGHRYDLWRRANPPPDGTRCWFVTALTAIGPARVRALTDRNGAYHIDLRTRTVGPA